MMKRILCFLICSLLMVPMLVSCSDPSSKEPAIAPVTTEPVQTDPPAPVEKTYKAAELMQHLRTTGRASLIGEVLALDWSWAKAELSGEFAAGAVSATLSLGYGSLADLMVVVDDDYENAKRIEITSKTPASVELCTLSAGVHNIKLYKNTQAMSGGLNLHDLTCTAHLAPASTEDRMSILVIGDSITCGAGAMPTTRPEGQSDLAEYSYGALLSKELNADVSILAISGWGIACGGMNYEALIPKIFDKTNWFRDQNAKWPFEKDSFDLVIVALGTNDYRFAGEGRTDVLIKASNDFLDVIREKNPSSRVLWVYGQMLNQYNRQLKTMIRERGDSKMAYMDLPTNVEGGFGHPNAAGHVEYCRLIKEWIDERF